MPSKSPCKRTANSLKGTDRSGMRKSYHTNKAKRKKQREKRKEKREKRKKKKREEKTRQVESRVKITARDRPQGRGREERMKEK